MLFVIEQEMKVSLDMELLVKLNQEGKTIIIVLHDLNHAAHFADHVIILADGRMIEQGTSHEVITEQIVRDVFGVASQVIAHPSTNKPLCLPLRRKIQD
ncbi:MAG: ABC transporter ATP-binding protein [Chloroflexi bacterium CFX2]|nr:ABC transporter ATP-binding protein [Chloroflexi bacterium CFX2]